MRRPIPTLALAILAATALAARAAPVPAEDAANDAGPAPKLVLSQWQSLYVAGSKIGYVAQSLYTLADGGHRLQTNLFLKRGQAADLLGYYKMTTADVDARFRPKAMTCRVVSGSNRWDTEGHAEGDEFVMKRTVNAVVTSAKAPIDDDMTLRSWALLATVLGGTKPGRTARWLVIDESLGALLPDSFLVHVVGPRSFVLNGEDQRVSGTAVVCVLGPERVLHLVEPRGRVLRSVWQSTPMVGVATGLTEARRLVGAAGGPDGTDVPGLAREQYHNPRIGLRMWVPPYPFVTHVTPELGIVQVTDLVDEASVLIRPAYGLRPGGAPPPAEDETDRQSDLIQREWAARFDEVVAEPQPAIVPVGAQGGDVRAVGGTARLGCTTFRFRNLVISGRGLTWFVSTVVADRDLVAKPMLLGNVVRSIQMSAPQGRLPIEARGLALRSPYYGFELYRPSPRWKLPRHADGPLTALEIARDDQAAAAIIRVLTPKPNQPLKDFVAERAQLAADNLGVTKPEPKPATLAGRDALEIAYEGPELLSGDPARCTVTYTELDGRVFALVLVVRTDADAGTARELDAIRRSLKFSRAAAPD